MISEGLWRRQFGGDPAIIGTSITLNSAATTVVGIAPVALSLIAGADVYTPLTIDRKNENRLNIELAAAAISKR